jgi:hypothetical protein
MDLTALDYKKIANYYQIPKSKNKTYKEVAEHVLASKLCRCIKSVNTKFTTQPNKTITNKDESSVVGICRKNIFQNRNLDFNNFQCKNKPKLLPSIGSSNVLKKTSKHVTFKRQNNRSRKKK